MKRMILAAALAFAMPAHAAPGLTEHQTMVVGCLEQMENGTTWGQCVNLMFSPCAAEAVGSDGHVACLTTQRDSWRETKDGLQRALIPLLTVAGGTEMVNLMGQWTGYVGQKCAEVGRQNTTTGAEAAVLGCEISELSGITVEFAACHDQISTAPYCVHEDK
ncbi:hypothetical protein [Algirhabdus cladophorae]|uniref:hypothetical protein n=1 Tax=Algirhabdus cladophorae TaxID=3377108 RepID=UPI003B8465D3